MRKLVTAALVLGGAATFVLGVASAANAAEPDGTRVTVAPDGTRVTVLPGARDNAVPDGTRVTVLPGNRDNVAPGNRDW